MAAKIMYEQPQVSAQSVPAPKPVPRITVVLLGSCFTAGTVSYLSKDWCCAPTGGAIMAAIAIGLSDRFLLVPLFKERAGVRNAQLLFTVGCVVAFGFLMKADPDNLFEQVIGIRPPPGVVSL